MDNSQATDFEKAHAGNTEGTDHSSIVKTLVRVFWILLIVTIVEVALALLHFYFHFLTRPFLNGIFILLTLVKAFYIVGEFMHFRHEVKQLVMIILVPLFFLLWGIGATMWEGGATKKARHEIRDVIETTVPWENVRHEWR